MHVRWNIETGCASMVYNQMSFNKKEAFVCWSVGDGCLDKKVDQTQVCGMLP